MSTVVKSTTNLVDSGIGPLSVTNSLVTAFDIDDFVHSTVRSQCIQLQLINAIQTANPTLAEGRPPLNINGNTVGGF